MKRILKISLALVFIATVLLLNYNISYAALGDGITATVTSSVPNGSEVKAGDKITYTIKLKNNSKDLIITSALVAEIPDGTEYVSATVSPNFKEMGSDADESEYIIHEENVVSLIPYMLDINDEAIFTITVKVKEGFSGEINFANRTGNEDDETDGIVVFVSVPYNENTISLESEQIENVFDKIAESNSLKEAQDSIKGVGYIDAIIQKQTHKVLSKEELEKKAEEEAEAKKKAEEEAASKKKAEEEAIAKKKAEEEAAAKKKAEEEATAKKAEEAKPVVKETKPTQLPKTGNEADIVVVLFGTIMIMTGTVLLIKQK